MRKNNFDPNYSYPALFENRFLAHRKTISACNSQALQKYYQIPSIISYRHVAVVIVMHICHATTENSLHSRTKWVHATVNEFPVNPLNYIVYAATS